MNRLEALSRFVWDFVVGDDWRIAVGVVVALALTALLAGTGAAAWWVLPPVIVALLSWSVWHAARPRR